MKPARFNQIAKIAKAACSQPTRADQKAACAAIGALSPEDKLAALRCFVDRYAKLRRQNRAYGDWAAHAFVAGCIGPREVLPWTRADVIHVLDAVRRETRVLPPELVARMVEQLLKAQGSLDRDLRKRVERVAKAMWPDKDAEGAAYKKAAARLAALLCR